MEVNYKIRNFRSIKEMNFTMKPITIVYGHNGAGKSSLMYSALFFKHILLSPSQPFEQLFNMPLFNLGSFDQVVYKHGKNDKIEVAVVAKDESGMDSTYKISIHPNECFFSIEISGYPLAQLKFSFPYALNQNVNMGPEGFENAITWNGLTAQLVNPPIEPEALNEANKLVIKINSLYNAAKNVDIVPLRRGFFKPIYNSTGKAPNAILEDDVASLINSDLGYSKGPISHYVEKIFDKTFTVFTPQNTNSFYLRMEDKANKGFSTELVNEGFGLNQVVFMLTKILQPETEVIFVEEPEVHLHPEAQKKLMESFIEIVMEDEKTICISTHSEILVTTLLRLVADKKIPKEKVQLYLAKRDKLESSIVPQEVKDDGTVEGGLMSFMEESLADLKHILGL